VKLSDIRTALAELDLHPSKSLGQNFLADSNLARWIVDQLDLSPVDHLVEIGPGLGALTECGLRLAHAHRKGCAPGREAGAALRGR